MLRRAGGPGAAARMTALKRMRWAWCGCSFGRNGEHAPWCVLNATANPRARDAMMLIMCDVLRERTTAAPT